jgi:hypothetical protein
MEVIATDIYGITYKYKSFRDAYKSDPSICAFSHIESVEFPENICHWYSKQKFNRWSAEFEQTIESINEPYKLSPNNSETIYWIKCVGVRDEIGRILPTNPRSIIGVVTEEQLFLLINVYDMEYEVKENMQPNFISHSDTVNPVSTLPDNPPLTVDVESAPNSPINTIPIEVHPIDARVDNIDEENVLDHIVVTEADISADPAAPPLDYNYDLNI